MLELAQTCNTTMTILSFLKYSFNVKKDILILQLISISTLTIPQKGHSLFAKRKIKGILAMVFTKSNPRLGKTASSKIFQLNGASSRHEQEKEYYLTETTGHCYCLVPVECLYTLLTEWGHLINSKMNGEHPRKIIALLSPHRKIHMNVLKRKKKAGILPASSLCFPDFCIVTAGTDGVWGRHLTS